MIVRLVSFNIRMGGAGREDLILSVLKEQRPDIVVLQEVTRTGFGRQLAAELGMEAVVPGGQFRQRVAQLSRLPIRAHRHYTLFPAECNIVRAEIEYRAGARLTLFGAHLTASAHLLPMELVRQLQARFTRRLLKRAGEHTVLAGDLNSVACGDKPDTCRMPMRYRSLISLQGGRHRSWAIPELERAGLVDAYRLLHPGAPGYTLPARDPLIRLDYMLVHRAMRDRVRRCEPVCAPEAVRRASDHLPVLMEIELD